MKQPSNIIVIRNPERRAQGRLGYWVHGRFIPIGQPLSVTLKQFDPDAQNQAVTPAPQKPLVVQTSRVIYRDLPYFQEACVTCYQKFNVSLHQKQVETNRGLELLIICPSCGQMHA